jgi:hypothetical protein
MAKESVAEELFLRQFILLPPILLPTIQDARTWRPHKTEPICIRSRTQGRGGSRRDRMAKELVAEELFLRQFILLPPILLPKIQDART